MPDALEMLHVGVSVNCMFNGNSRVEELPEPLETLLAGNTTHASK
jgi:hypothetical protein